MTFKLSAQAEKEFLALARDKRDDVVRATILAATLLRNEIRDGHDGKRFDVGDGHWRAEEKVDRSRSVILIGRWVDDAFVLVLAREVLGKAQADAALTAGKERRL
jgi:hypothetical protein